jgi:hypothetical protein
LAGSHAYVADDVEGLRVIDISTPSTPVEVGFVDTPGNAVGVAVSPGYAYVADGYSGLRVIDISSPSTPVEAGSIDTPGYAYDVAISGSYVYVADGFAGLRVINVSTPSAPVEDGFVDTPGRAEDVVLDGGFAYVADHTAGLRVIDVSDPSDPHEEGFIDWPGPVQDMGVAVEEGFVYLAEHDPRWFEGDYPSRLRVIDVSIPAAPQEVGNAEAAFFVMASVALSGGQVFVTGGNVGIFVFAECGGVLFHDGFESGDTSAWSATVP